MQQLGRLLNHATDETTYQQSLAAAKQIGLDVSSAPPSFDPQWVGQQKLVLQAYEKDGGAQISGLARELSDAGYKPGTPEFQQAMATALRGKYAPQYTDQQGNVRMGQLPALPAIGQTAQAPQAVQIIPTRPQGMSDDDLFRQAQEAVAGRLRGIAAGRTAAEGASEEQLTLDVQRLQMQWEEISRRVETQQAPVLLHSEPDLLIKIVRDVFNEDFQKMVISGEDAREVIEEYLKSVAPDLLERVSKYDGSKDIFDEYRVGEQIAKALERKVYLPSGGSLVIDRTEAMTVVDVNTGKFVGSGGNLEETVTKNNLEAAEEIVRQLRLRDIGGIIVVDFIDMVLESNRDLVSRRLMECLSRDRTKHQVAEVTSLGLVQMTRKKLGIGLLEAFSEPCEACASRGVIVHHEPIMRSKGNSHEESRPQQQKQGKKNRGNGNNGGNNGNSNNGGNQQPKVETAKVVTPERAVELNNVIGKIAASTVAAHEAAGEESPIVLPTSKISDESAQPVETEKLLEAVLDALPEPKAPGQGRRKPRRATSGAAAAPVAEASSVENKG